MQVFQNKKLCSIVGSNTLKVRIDDVTQGEISFIVDLSLGEDMKLYRGDIDPFSLNVGCVVRFTPRPLYPPLPGNISRCEV